MVKDTRVRRFKSRAIVCGSHTSNFGRGYALSNDHRETLLNLAKELEKSLERDYNVVRHKGKGRHSKKLQLRPKPKSLHEEFKRFSGGHSWDVVKRARKTASNNNGRLEIQLPAGRKPKAPLEELIPEIDAFIDAEVQQAKYGGYLTVTILRDKLREKFSEQQEMMTRERVRKSLKRMGFKYAIRKGVWISRREDPQILEDLRAHCAWVAENVAQDDEGYYYFIDPVVFHDQSFINSLSLRKESWVRDDRWFDGKDNGGGRRIVLLDSLHTGKFITTARVAWDSTLKTGIHCDTQGDQIRLAADRINRISADQDSVTIMQNSFQFRSKFANFSEFLAVCDTLYKFSRDLVKFQQIFIEVGAKFSRIRTKNPRLHGKNTKNNNEIRLKC